MRKTRTDSNSAGPKVVRRFEICYLQPEIVPNLRSSLHSALKEFFEPLRTNDPRTDFFAVYQKISAEFDRGYENKYDEDLNTSLIFVSDPRSTCYA